MYVFESKEIAVKFSPILNKISCVIADEEFRAELKAVSGFFNTTASGIDVLQNLDAGIHSGAAYLMKMGMKRFKPWYRNTTAETNGLRVELNPKFMNRDDADQANTLVHEWLHVVGYSHIWNNSRKYPQILSSVNYVVGNMVEKHYRRIFGQ